MSPYGHLIKQTPEGWWVMIDDTHLSRWVEQGKRLDHDTPVLEKFIPYLSPGTIAIDVGAALGDHTLFYLEKVGPTGKVIAYEPHPVQYECLIRNCPKAHAYCNAVGEREDDVYLFHQPDIVAGSRLIDPALGWPMSKTRRLRLDGMSAYGYAHYMGSRISFIKIDVEGCEPEVLRGGYKLILEHRPVIWLEINPEALERQNHSVEELRNVIEMLRYSVAEFYPDGGSWDGYQGNQCDVLLCPEPI